MLKGLSLASGCALAGVLISAAPLLTAAPASAGVQSATAHTELALARAASPQNPNPGRFDDWSSTGASNLCFSTTGGTFNWSTFGCRNIDKAIGNGLSVAIRLYFSPNEAGAWTCVPVGLEINNLNSTKYTFNSGTGAGAGEKIYNNVASSAASTADNCTNPIGS